MELSDVTTLFATQLTAIGTFVTATVTAVWPVLLGAVGLALSAGIAFSVGARFNVFKDK